MSKILKLSDESFDKIKNDTMQEVLKEISDKFEKAKSKDDFENKLLKSVQEVISKGVDEMSKSKMNAKVIFTQEAWIKMMTMIQMFETEIGWYGLVRREDQEDSPSFVIYDILAYPQSVTSVTVVSDDEKHSQWFQDLDDDTFNHLRMHGHSHVNMGASPSGTDLNNYKERIEVIIDDDFYIFMIWNKKLNNWIEIYDKKNNVVFDTDSIDVSIEGIEIKEFMKTCKSMIVKKPTLYQDMPKANSKTNEKTDKKTDKKLSPKEKVEKARQNKKKEVAPRNAMNNYGLNVNCYNDIYSGMYNEYYGY